jgi:formate-dependent nitrite reductase membrane component NrfD
VATHDVPIVGDSFQVGYRFQRYWDTPMANAFFCGELGAGLFFVSLWFGFLPGMLTGLLITGILKTYFHISHMGVPMKSWRAMLRPDRSWISRGLISIMVWSAFGFAHVLNLWFDLETVLGFGSIISGLIKLVAAAAALMVMTYQGFAISHSTAISLWSSGLMPVSSLVYALTAGTFLTLVLGWNGFLAEQPDKLNLLINGALFMLVVIAVVLLSLLHGAHHGSPGGRTSVELLVKSLYAKWFLGVVWGTGLILPALLLWAAAGSYAAVILAALGMLAGYYAYRVLIFKAGVFEPIMSFRP